MERKLQTLAKKLETAGIKVVAVKPSPCLELEDHEITLENGFYVSVPPTGLPSLSKENADGTFVLYPPVRNLVGLVQREMA